MDSDYEHMWPPGWVARLTTDELNPDEEDVRLTPLDGAPEINSDDQKNLNDLSYFGPVSFFREPRIFASAPVRSKPQRTYDPARPTRAPEGDYVPMYLANLMAQDKGKWEFLKKQLEVFGRAAGPLRRNINQALREERWCTFPSAGQKIWQTSEGTSPKPD